MVSCGNSNTGSKDDDLSVLDLLLQQDNFGDFDGDGISDDFGTRYELLDHLRPIHSHNSNGECILEIDPEHVEDEKKEGHEPPPPPDEILTPDPPTPIVLGCTNPQAENYDPNATEDNGSCIFPAIPPTVPPTSDPDLSSYAEFLTVVTKAEAEAKAEKYFFYPKSYADQEAGVEKTNGKTDSLGRYTQGAGKLNCKYMGQKIGYYSSPGDGSEGYFKWIELYNYRNASYWFPAPRPLYIATKYWRTGGYDDGRARTSGHSVGCNQQVVKDGMYTAGKCPEVTELVIHTTGCPDTRQQREPLRHSAGSMTCDPYQPYIKDAKGKTVGNGSSTMPYHWMLRKDGWASQQMPDWKTGAGTGKRGSNKSDHRNVAITWMTYNDPREGYCRGGYPKTAAEKGRILTMSEAGGTTAFTGKFRGVWPTDAQIIGMAKLVAIYIKRYPDITIAGHHQFRGKACPNFWVPAWIRSGGIPGLNQAGIDKLLQPTSTMKYEQGDKYKGYSYQKSCSYGDQKSELLTFAGEELAKISNPAGIGGGSVPFPNSNTSNPNIPVPAGKLVKDMDCNEFKVYYDANWKNISPGIRTGRMNAMSPEDQEDLIDKTRDCI